MRRQQLGNPEAFAVVEAPVLDVRSEARPQPASAVPDMPKAAGILMVAVYGALMAAFALTIHGARADFAIVVGLFYLAMFFGLPIAILGMERDPARRPTFGEFLDRGMDTATGRISGGGALVQMLMVPALLALGVLAMGITYLVS